MPDTRPRIGELSKRSGVSPELLRAWERRYGLLEPVRSPGGLRLYSRDDLERVRLMLQHLATGLAAATRDALLVDLLLPFLREAGDGWRRGETSSGAKHFASNLIRGRMLGLARGSGRGLGPVALLACLPGERHELDLIAFGLAFHAGWRIAYLGSDTPLDEIERASANDPDLIVLAAISRKRIRPSAARIRTLAKRRRVALGGAGAADEDAKTLGVLALTGAPVSEAKRIAAGWTTV